MLEPRRLTLDECGNYGSEGCDCGTQVGSDEDAQQPQSFFFVYESDEQARLTKSRIWGSVTLMAVKQSRQKLVSDGMQKEPI